MLHFQCSGSLLQYTEAKVPSKANPHGNTVTLWSLLLRSCARKVEERTPVLPCARFAIPQDRQNRMVHIN